jgi:nucleoside 2-deoxyribosyltransferase
MANRKVFVACPIGDDNSPERERSDKLLKYVIHPVVKELVSSPPEEVTVRADKMGQPGRITTQVLRELVEADVVIADLTETNANVMYEVGVRQALVRPLVLMAEKGQKIPFDLNDLRTIFYQLDLEHVEAAQNELRSHLKKALSGEVSPLDQALFIHATTESASGTDQTSSRSLLAVLEVCESILKETQDTKGIVSAVGRIAMEIKEDKEEEKHIRQERTQQEMTMFLMSQFFQNPDSAEKLMPALQKMAEFGEAQKLTNPQRPISARDRRAGRKKR